MGQNENGQLCRKSVETKEPGLVDDPNIINKVVAVACGYDHTVIVLGT
jgi:alpha-tubulin suppressor-like RCC1 family protein